MFLIPTIKPLDTSLQPLLQSKIDSKTKPLGALGRLEDIALSIGLIQKSLRPKLRQPTIIVFAADHGITQEGVSPYPQEVTQQMVHNFLAEGAAINVLSKPHGIEVLVVDAGVNCDFEAHPKLMAAKVAHGTANMLHEPAMTAEQRDEAIRQGRAIVAEVAAKGCNIVGFGEMGIGNTSASSLIISLLGNLPIEACVGMGTGHEDNHLEHKREILEKVRLAYYENCPPDYSGEPLDILRMVGGFEIAQMMGGMLEAAQCGITIMVDGFISTAAFMLAWTLEPHIKDYAFFSHLSNEQGHRWMLEYINAKPLLNLDMRLGEGSGIAVAYPLIVSAVAFLNEMATFSSAGVSTEQQQNMNDDNDGVVNREANQESNREHQESSQQVAV